MIRFNYMSTEQDWIDFRACIRLTREIFARQIRQGKGPSANAAPNG